MKHQYAGIEIDLGYSVEIIDIDAAVPIFHRSHGWIDRDKGWRTKTKCGLTMYEETPLENGNYYATNHVRASLHPRHAVKFARPCTKCWPELRAQRSLFQEKYRKSHPEQSVLA